MAALPLSARQLMRELPALGSGAEIEEQARAILALVLEAMERAEVLSPSSPDPSTCPNCGKPAASTRSPYCGDGCREIASFVRQFRAGLAKGWLLDREKQIAMGQVLWFLLGGGRPLRQSLIPDRAKQRVIERAGGACEVCGKVATTVDHIATGCNRPINLRAVCEACCRARPFGEPAVLESLETQSLLSELAERIAAPMAIRCSDDAETWDWRAYLKARSAG